MTGTNTTAGPARSGEKPSRTAKPRVRRGHRGPKGAAALDLLFKYDSRDGWSATLRNDPTVVLVADNGDEIADLSRELALAIFQDRGAEALQAMREAGKALPAPAPEPQDLGSETARPRMRLTADPVSQP